MSQLLFMIVEDEENSLNLFESLLRHKGIETIGVKSAEKGLELLEVQHPNLILIDLDLPVMNGFDMLAAIRKNPMLSNTRVVAVTAYDSPSVAAEALSLGFDMYFAKPIRSETFAKDLIELVGV
ncbi:MAG: response regulator [Chloroflexi bacterium]|nr:response regulator [Chloroflexota bacterium]